MRFKPGDLVIKNTGGNKMRVLNCKEDGTCDCLWATEVIHEASFYEDDIVSIEEYKSIIISEKREDLINKIIS